MSVNTTKLVHDESNPLPSSLGLDELPKLMLNCFTSVRKAKPTLLDDRS